MNRQRHSSGRSDRWLRKPAKVSQRYGCTTCGSARRQYTATSAAPASSAIAALSSAEAPAPSTATRRPRSAAKSIGSAAWGAQMRGQGGDEGRHPPRAHAVLPGRQNDLARVAHGAVGEGGGHQVTRRGDLRHFRPAADGHADGVAHPEQVGGPVLSGDQVQRLPVRGAVAGLVPGLVGQAGQVQVRPGVVLRRAQRPHAGVAEPWPFHAARGPVHHQDVVHLRPQQPHGHAQPGLPAAHDQHVQRGRAIGGGARGQPFHAGVGDAVQVVAHVGSQGRKRVVPSKTIRQASLHPPPVRCPS